MSNTAVPGYTDIIGKHGIWIGDHTGPLSYLTGGETVLPQYFGLRSIDYLNTVGLSLSGNYFVYGQMPSTGSRLSAMLRWFYSGVGSQGIDGIFIATAGSGQTNGTFTVAANSGTGTIQVVIAGGAITSVRVLNPGSYSAPPTFTIAEGGTPGTVTATIGSPAGIEVAPGTNLSAETVRLEVIGG